MAWNRVFYISIVLLSLVYKSTSIHCYYCNSANNTACLDINKFDHEERSRIIPIVNCETAIPSPVAVNFFCRKIIQTIYHPYHDSEVRVTRGCGWVRSERECYNANNQDHLETVCQCFDDHCNSGNNVDPTSITALFLILSAVLFYWR